MNLVSIILTWLALSNAALATCNGELFAIMKAQLHLATPFCSQWLKITPATITVTATATPSPKPTAKALFEREQGYYSYPIVPAGVRSFGRDKVSSVCKCLSLTTATVKITKTITASYKTTSTTKKVSSTSSSVSSTSTPSPSGSTASTITSSSSKTSSSLITSTLSSSSSSTSSTSGSSTSTTSSTTLTGSVSPPTPACDPIWVLSGVDEIGYNAYNQPFSASISCGSLNQTAVVVYVNGAIYDSSSFTVSSTSVHFSAGLVPNYAILGLMALDSNGYPFISTFQLLFGSSTLIVTLNDANGNPAANVPIEANSTQFNGFTRTLVTDGNGQVSFTNLPAMTVGLVARTADNQIAAAGVASALGQTTMQLIPFNDPAATQNFDFSDGSEGWTGGTTATHVEKRFVHSRRAFEARKRLSRRDDLDLMVNTNGQPNLQKASATFKTYPFTKTVFIRFKFVTSEVPGGYFGSQYNDYFIVTIRSDTGALATMTNSMNALGLGAFDSSGATDWMQLTLSVPSNCKSVQFDIGVSNVADSALDSQVIVDKAGDLTCDQCGDCSACPGDPMCSDSCQTPQQGSCAFYRDCVEKSVPCAGDANSYALNYGEKNCDAYKNNLNHFSAKGQSFVLGTMMCLQAALRPVVNCGSSCPSIKTTAFNSHPGCYLQNGFCGLPCEDYAAVLWTIGGELVKPVAWSQIVATVEGCLANIKQTFAPGTCSLNAVESAIVFVAITGLALVP